MLGQVVEPNERDGRRGGFLGVCLHRNNEQTSRTGPCMADLTEVGPWLPGGASGKEPACQAGDIRDADSIPGLERSSGEGHGNPLQYSCLENPMDRGAWGTTVHGVTQSWTRLKQLSTHAHMHGSLNSSSGWRSCSDCSGQVLCRVFFFF